MKLSAMLFSGAFAGAFCVMPVAAQDYSPALLPFEIIEHGGGCRKDSPSGQCCHAGSQPYHCH